MKTGFCQFNVRYKDVDANLNKVKEMLFNTNADLIVLPELCFSGYYFKSKEELYEFSNEEILQRIIYELGLIAKSRDLYIVAGTAEKNGDNVYNSALLIGPEGLIGKHRKVNLTTNEKIFSRGDKFEIFEISNDKYGKIKIGIVICFDSWFPESCRILALQGAQIICCPSNFGGPWTPDVLKVRSLENKVYTILSNRTGSEMTENEQSDFRGESQIIDFGGNVIETAAKEECVITADINPDEVVSKGNIICDDMSYELSLYNKFVKYKI